MDPAAVFNKFLVVNPTVAAYKKSDPPLTAHRNVIFFISDIVESHEKLSDTFTLPELEELIRANTPFLLEERENEELKRNLVTLAYRLDQEFVSIQATLLAASLRSLVAAMENPALQKESPPMAK